MRRLLPALVLLAGPVSARDALGVFNGWGAFRDAQPRRCFAIAEPVRRSGFAWRPFAAVSHWPTERIRGQVQVRLSRAVRPATPVVLAIGDRRFPLVAGGADAWAPDARIDAAIVASMRSGPGMSISAVAADGTRFADSYPLKGAATAIDAAALGCAR